MEYFVYILSNKNHTVFYTGITNDLIIRTYEHRKKLIDSFTGRYNINKLLYFEVYSEPDKAILREKQIKKYSQKKKFNLILEKNPNLDDLYDELLNN